MEIQDSTTGLLNAIMNNNWCYVSSELKEKWFFIFNRYTSKKYPKETYLLNLKGMDKENGMEILYCFLSKKIKEGYPAWLWSKSKNNFIKEKEHKDDTLLKNKLDINDDELMKLKLLYAEELSEELKYFKTLEKNKEK